MDSLEHILGRVGSAFGVRYTDPEFSFVEGIRGICWLDMPETADDGHLVVNNAQFEIPVFCRDNPLALKGYFAHELAHVLLLDDTLHVAYLKARNFVEEGSNWLIPLRALLSPLILSGYYWYERQVDKIANEHGYSDAINEARKYTPL